MPFSCTGYAHFEEMYRAEHPCVLKNIWRRVGNQAVADDLTQDTFIRVLRNVDRYTPQENKPLRDSFKNWIGKIARNVVIDYCKRKNLEQTYSSHVAKSTNEEYSESTLGEYNISNAEDLLQRKEGLEETMRAIGSIADPGKRETARLWFIEDKKYKEISAELAIPRGTVMSRLSRAKDEMRVLFYQHE